MEDLFYFQNMISNFIRYICCILANKYESKNKHYCVVYNLIHKLISINYPVNNNLNNNKLEYLNSILNKLLNRIKFNSCKCCNLKIHCYFTKLQLYLLILYEIPLRKRSFPQYLFYYPQYKDLTKDCSN